MDIRNIQSLAEKIRRNVSQVIVGKHDVIDLMLVSLIASGHVLLEDVPGTGKTLLAKALAKSLHCDFRRIQFTPDLLPSDLSGINFYNQKSGEFQFRPGPVFTNILLADEINRATPRTQSSLLECMEERQVTIDGETRRLAPPFMVIATQNPVENQGTFPLPEAQLDRFLIKISMGYPSTEEGMEILRRFRERNPLEQLEAVAEAADLIAAQKEYASVHVSDDILAYLLRIAEETRKHPDIALGVSPRGSQALLRAVQAYAAIHGRDYVTPDDIKAMAKPVLGHRIVYHQAMRLQKKEPDAVLERIIESIPVPAESLTGR
jgi:MoxR-like ATPase